VALTHRVETITVAKAEKMLETNTKNRRLSDRIVQKYAEMMRTGRWVDDGSPIRRDEAGNLLDGQHRLWAVIESETEQQFLVVTGIPEEAMTTMDTGKHRSFQDILSMYDPSLHSLPNLAANTSMIYRWEQGARGSALRPRGNSSQFVPYADLLDFFKANQERMVELTRESHRVRRLGMNGTTIALGYWLFDALDKDDSDYFWERFHDGVELAETDAIYALRRWVDKNATTTPPQPAEVQVALTVKAWNSYRDGEEVHVLSWKRGGQRPEPFPEPH
jgi:hypothetical protein